MVADADLQVWLDTQGSASQTVMIPYVRSAKDVYVSYRMDVIQRSGGSTSRISQSGKVNAIMAQNTALTRVALTVQKDGECRVELKLNEEGKGAVTYHFNCAEQD